MSDSVAYYYLKGLIADLPAESQAEIERARVEIIAIAQRSENGFLGLCLAGSEMNMDGKSPMK